MDAGWAQNLFTEEERKKVLRQGRYKKCFRCGKEFYIPIGRIEEYAYKKKTRGSYGRERFFCSWGCLSEYRKEKEQGRTKKDGK